MTSTTTTDPASAVVAVEETVEKPARKFPPPCWTQVETLCLIEAYRERWYALRRGYLRTADWDAVAATVASRCPGASPAKTSAQCRHKMEKLRQRYRAEKQRALSYPYPAGRYFSSWFFFDNMEAMENGTSPPTSARKAEDSADGSQLKTFLDHSILKLKVKPTNDADSIPDLGFVKANKRFTAAEAKIPSNDYNSYLDMGFAGKQAEEIPQDEYLMNFRRRKAMNGIGTPPVKSKTKNPNRIFNNYEDSGGGLHQEMLRAKKFGKVEQRSDFDHRAGTINDEFWGNFSSDGKINSSSRANYWGGSNPTLDSRATMNNHNSNRSKRERFGALEEMVASIKYLGEGFMKMERAKMEMAQEMEAVRMEMEMKRNEMLLDSQKQIVDAFVKGLFEMKRNKKKLKAGFAEADSEQQQQQP